MPRPRAGRAKSATILWRRLDLPGHEAAELRQIANGWELSGVAVVADAGRPCRLEYVITCGAKWLTRRCVVRGYIGSEEVALDLARAATGEWTANGAPAQHLKGCDDVDLAFSPVTNLLPIRRLRLDVGAAAPVRTAWVRFPEITIEVLEQMYTRVAPDRYLYESAGGTFQRELTVDATGLVLEYPDLWIAEARAGDVDFPGSRSTNG